MGLYEPLKHYSSFRRIALAQGLSFQEVYQQATAQARKEFLG